MVLRPFDIEHLPPFQRPLQVSGVLRAERPTALRNGRFRGQVSIGAFSYVNENTTIYSCSIGRYTSIAHQVMIGPAEHPTNWLSTHSFPFGGASVFGRSPEYLKILNDQNFEGNRQSVSIGNDVWIGHGVLIKSGLTIGDGAIVGAGSIVTKDVEPYAIVAGNPAKLIRYRFASKIIDRLQKLEWWNYLLEKDLLPNIDYSDPESASSQIEDTIASGILKPWKAKSLLFKNVDRTLKCFSIRDISDTANKPDEI